MIRKRVTVVLAVAAILFPAGCGRMKPVEGLVLRQQDFELQAKKMGSN